MASNVKYFQSLGIIQTSSAHQQELSSSSSSSGSAFPILVVALLSIMGTTLLLASYYIFVVKCCSNWHIFNPLRRFTMLATTTASTTAAGSRQDDESFIAFSPTTTNSMWNNNNNNNNNTNNRGLDESIIREIPTFQFQQNATITTSNSVFGCVVCLNQFQVHDTLKSLPNCNHAFHLDCIDIWLQKNSNCPLCRTYINTNNFVSCAPSNQIIIAPSSSPRDFQLYSSDNSLMGSDEDFVVIELGGEEQDQETEQEQEREQVTNNRVTSYHSPRKLKKCHHVSIMGDECIDLRINREHNKDYYDNEEEFSVQPLRRSFSWDSATDHRQLHSTVEEIISNNNKKKNYTRTSFFPFLHGRVSSWNSIVPFEL
ncbi:hypothetical protein CsatB_025155 [Cannabis sativa]